jgi:hypothetical protein
VTPVRFCACLGLILLVGGSGCYTAPPIGSACRPNVFVMRGIIGYWPFIETFEDALCDEGLCPTIAFAEQYHELADDIAEGTESGQLKGPLVIVGYSVGANGAIHLCRRLEERNITVDKLVLLETSYDEEIPANVRSCFNIYKSQPLTDWFPIFRGIPLEAESGGTELVNYDLRCEAPEICCWDNHLTMCMNRRIHDLMIDEVLDEIDGGGRCASQAGSFPRECR